MDELKMYRSVIPKNDGKEQFCEYKSTMRPPGNVPYIVDNLWEWKRPENFPCRRFCAYASSDPELALKSGPDGGKVFVIEFIGEPKIAQLTGCSDSKYHPECGAKTKGNSEYKNLKKLMINLLNEVTDGWWPNLDREEKLQAGQIWMPCLKKSEVNYLFENIPALQLIRDEVASNIRYWDDVRLFGPSENSLPDGNGEIFFEAKDGYWLKPLDELSACNH